MYMYHNLHSLFSWKQSTDPVVLSVSWLAYTSWNIITNNCIQEQFICSCLIGYVKHYHHYWKHKFLEGEYIHFVLLIYTTKFLAFPASYEGDKLFNSTWQSSKIFNPVKMLRNINHSELLSWFWKNLWRWSNLCLCMRALKARPSLQLVVKLRTLTFGYPAVFIWHHSNKASLADLVSLLSVSSTVMSWIYNIIELLIT